MCDELPVGDFLLFKTVRHIEDCFGIIYADIEAPTIEDLRIPLLPRRLASGDVVVPHKGKWFGWYPTIDLKTAIEYKYKVTPKIGYHFDKGCPTREFVESIILKK